MKEYTHVIIVDEDNKPMAWDGTQLAYCDNDTWEDEPHPVKIYTKAWAKRLIKKSINFREDNYFPIGEYRTIPVKLYPL